MPRLLFGRDQGSRTGTQPRRCGRYWNHHGECRGGLDCQSEQGWAPITIWERKSHETEVSECIGFTFLCSRSSRSSRSSRARLPGWPLSWRRRSSPNMHSSTRLWHWWKYFYGRCSASCLGAYMGCSRLVVDWRNRRDYRATVGKQGQARGAGSVRWVWWQGLQVEPCL